MLCVRRRGLSETDRVVQRTQCRHSCRLQVILLMEREEPEAPQYEDTHNSLTGERTDLKSFKMHGWNI